MSEHRVLGVTRHGIVVHHRTIDHMPAGSLYQRFNKRVAMALTAGVGTMTTFWIFCVLALLSLPAVLSAFGPFAHTFPPFLIKASIIALVAWVAQTFIQLVLLPALMVGQNLQNEASDARNAKQFEFLTDMHDWLNLNVAGGLTDVLAEVKAERSDLDGVLTTLRSILSASTQAKESVPATPKPPGKPGVKM